LKLGGEKEERGERKKR
jgi:hypothetical protein